MLKMEVRVTSASLLVDTKKNRRKTFRRAGAEVLAEARSEIRKASGGGRIYRGSGGHRYRPYKPGRYQASAAGEPPVNVTGTLARSGKVYPFRDGEGVAVRFRAFYAKFLEGGAKGGGRGKKFRNKRSGTGSVRVLEKRPFVTRALEQRRASLVPRLKAAMESDLVLQRVKR